MATNIYMNIDGIAGNSTSSNYPNQFEVLSLNFGVSNLATVGSTSTGSGAGKPTFTPITATIRDYNLPPLVRAVAVGARVRTVAFSLIGYDATGTEFPVESITLSDVAISQLQYSAAGDAPILELAFAYREIQVKENGATFTFDTAKNSIG